MSNLVDGIAHTVENLANLPAKIGNLVLDGIKAIFIPDVQTIENQIDAAVDNISSQLGVQFNTFDHLFDREVAPEDVDAEYEIHGVGKLNLKFFDTDFLIEGISYFRPVIRAFIVFLLVLFVWRQILSFIGQDPGIASGAYNNYQEWKKGE